MLEYCEQNNKNFFWWNDRSSTGEWMTMLLTKRYNPICFHSIPNFRRYITSWVPRFFYKHVSYTDVGVKHNSFEERQQMLRVLWTKQSKAITTIFTQQQIDLVLSFQMAHEWRRKEKYLQNSSPSCDLIRSEAVLLQHKWNKSSIFCQILSPSTAIVTATNWSCPELSNGTRMKAKEQILAKWQPFL